MLKKYFETVTFLIWIVFIFSIEQFLLALIFLHPQATQWPIHFNSLCFKTFNLNCEQMSNIYNIYISGAGFHKSSWD